MNETTNKKSMGSTEYPENTNSFPKESAISIKNLKKSFDNGKHFIINDLNLDLPKGKITVIIGFSGTGKSVLLKLILGLMKPSSGSIEVFSKNIWDLTESEWLNYRQRLGVLFQNGGLFNDMTVLENTRFPLRESYRQKGRHLGAQEENFITKEAIKKLNQLNLNENDYNKYPDNLSGGMKKRAALARALMLNPDILFYDEPTTGLDPVLTEMVSQLIQKTHSHKKQATSVVVSHDMHSTFQIGDFIVMLDQGKVIFSGGKKDFINSDIQIVRQFVLKGLQKP